MRLVRSIPVALAAATIIAGCNTETQQQLATVSHADSLRVDSLGNVRKDLMEEVMTSTQFVTEINRELSKARALASKQEPQLETTGEMTPINEQRKLIVARDHPPRRPPRLGPGPSFLGPVARHGADEAGFGARRPGRRV